MTEIAKDKPLWQKSIDKFSTIYNRKPSTPKDYARISHIYTIGGGQFINQESIIPFTIKESIHQEGVLDNVKTQLMKLFKSPIALGIALFFLNNLLKKSK